MEATVSPPLSRADTGALRFVDAAPKTILAWFAGFAVLVFGVSAVFADTLKLQHDAYYLIYATVLCGFLFAFTRRVHADWSGMLRKNLGWSLGIGALVAVATVNQVLGDTATSHPNGVYFAFELVWRGIVYGLTDTLALFVFPALIALMLMNGDRSGIGRKLGYAALTILLTLGVCTTYHLGYSQFRGADLRNPDIGAVVFSIPAAITGNPAGSLIAHPVVHTTAVAHEYYGHDPGFLPPNLVGYDEHAAGAGAWSIGAVWLAVGAVVIAITRRSRGHHPKFGAPRPA